MKKRLLFFLLYFLYWIVFFVVARLIFLLYNHPLSFSLTLGEWFSVSGYGLRMDASMAGYLVFIAALIFVATTFAKAKTTANIISVYTLVLSAIVGILVVADMELYRHWGFRLDSTPLSYLKTPKEALGSASIPAAMLQSAVFVLLVWGFRIVYKKVPAPYLEKSETPGWVNIPVFLLAAAFMILPVRGSLGVAPMNVGFVYFHPTNIFANHAAINVAWNAGKSLLSSNDVAEYRFMDDGKAERLFAECYPPAGHTEILLKNNRPDIVLIILESFSNRLVEPLGGLTGITPNLNRYCREGVLFSGVYSNSDRTDKGILGVLNGYPVHPVAKVINFAEKTRQLPYLNKDLKRTGYATEFVYGYDIRYSNFASYFGNAGYDNIITREDFPPETYMGSKWGVHDHLVLDKLLDRCNHSESPFFKVFMGLSSHEPFDVPMATVFEGSDAENLFLNSVYYSDKALGDFIEGARKSSWWDNSLIVITADHGSRHPGNVSSYAPEKFHVPMLWLGGALAVKDTVIRTVAGQTDIAPTILHQLGLTSEEYLFSKDILGKPVFQSAFYDFNNGFGFVTENTRIAFDNVSRTVIHQEGVSIEETAEKGKAYLQVFSNDFKFRDQGKNR